jgi:antitoxin VapB
MALNIKNREVEKLAEEVAGLTGDSKTEAIRKALEQQRQRLRLRVFRQDRKAVLLKFLETEVWPEIPEGARGKAISKRQKEKVLGYGPEGV